MADALPTTDELAGSSGQGDQLPTTDELAGGGDPSRIVRSGPSFDDYFTRMPVGRILDVFGQGAKQGWGTDPLPLWDTTQELLKKSGLLDQAKDNHSTFAKGFNEGFLRPAAAAIAQANDVLFGPVVTGAQVALRGGQAVFSGLQGATAQTGAELEQTDVGRAVGAKALFRDIAAMPEAFMGTPHVTGVPRLPADIAHARSLGVIGEGEEGYFGTKEPTPESQTARAEAIKAQGEAQAEAGPHAGQTEEGQPSPAVASPAPDIHAVARQIAPETFQKYDALAARHDTFTRWVGELRETRAADPRVVAAQAEIDTILGKVGGVEDRLTNKAAARLEDIRGGMEDFLQTDTPDMIQVKKALGKNFQEMQDLAPAVATAYRKAGETANVPEQLSVARENNAPAQAVAEAVPGQQEAPGAGVQPVSEAATQGPAVVPGVPSAIPAELAGDAAGRTPAVAGAEKASEPNAQISDIASDVQRKLIAAGRPAEEANAAAAIVASHYDARAARFGGAKGTGAELYAKEGPDIRGAGKATKRELELAQKGKTLGQPLTDKATFYSALTRGVEGLKMERAPADQWANTIKNLPGIKQEELDWSGVQDWLKEQKGPISKADLLAHLRENEVNVQEVEKGRAPDTTGWKVERSTGRNHNSGTTFPQQIVRDEGGNVVLQDASRSLTDEELIAKAAPRRLDTKFGAHTLPGGENYRELLLTLPTAKAEAKHYDIRREGDQFRVYPRGSENWISQHPTEAAAAKSVEASNFRDQMAASSKADFKSSHFDEPNVLAHVRFDDRKGPNGEKILHIAEVQSDWHQKGRREGYQVGISPDAEMVATQGKPDAGYFEVSTKDGRFVTNVTDADKQTPELAIAEARRRLREEPRRTGNDRGVPNAPFKSSWSELAMKRMLRYAAEHGYDRLSWDTGETESARYDLSKQIDDILYRKEKNGDYYVGARKDGKKVLSETYPASKLPDVLGKDVADKIVNGHGEDYEVGGAPGKKLSGLDLKVGGEGMKGFYDKILPAFLNKYAKKWGAKVEDGTVPKSATLSFEDFKDRHVRMWPEVTADHLREAYDNYKSQTANAAVHQIEITPAMRESVMQGQPLFQAKRGSITLKDASATIKLFKSADASTFMHETGHQWLEELMRDDADEAAPPDLKADAQTVRDWLGVKDGEEIATKQHEKWARGFERYLMEGTAPSKGLAAVFAKFKAWLTQIYQTVQKLRSPITDDIRDVFDRLIVSNPEKTTIAPERPVEASMADIHEAAAERTPPEHAAAVAENVRAEIDNATQKVAPEVHDELPGKSETGGISGTNEGLSGSGDASRSIGAENGSPETVGAEPAGRDETAAEGGDVRAEPSAGSRATARSGGTTELPISPNARFAGPESDLIDKAGNIRLENLNTTQDVKEVIRETAAENDNFMGARRGVVSDAQAMSLADAMGMNPAMLDLRKIGQAFNKEQIFALEKLLIQSATNVRDAMKQDDEMVYAEAVSRHQMILDTVQEHASGVRAEAGRALQAYNALKKMEGYGETQDLNKFLEENVGKTLFQLREEMKWGNRLQTPAQVSKFVRDSSKHNFHDMILEYYINALISGPITHLRYAVGNFLNAVWTPLVEIPSAAGIGAVRRGLGLGDEGRVYLGEAGAQLYAMGKGSRDGWSAAYEAFKTGVSPALPGEILPANFLDASGKVLPKNAIPGTVGKVINLPSRSVSAIHSFFKALRYEQNIQGLAYRTAMDEGLTGNAFANRVSDLTTSPPPEMMDKAEAYIENLNTAAAKIAKKEGLEGKAFDDRIAELTEHPTPEMKAAAVEKGGVEIDPQLYRNVRGATSDSLKELYMAPTDYHSLGGKLTRAANHNVFTKIMVPFMKIGTQITRNAFIERTPLGILSREVRGNLMGEAGGAAQDMQAGKIPAGIALAGLTVGLVAEGLATGDGPSDPKVRATWLLTHKPNSLTIGDISIPYKGLGSLGMIMSFSANMYETAHGMDGETTDKMALGFLEGATKSVLDENFMRGVKDMLDAVYHPEEYGDSYTKQFALNWLPFSVGLSQVARQVDPFERETKSWFDAARAKFPGWSEADPPRRDMFGEPIPQGGARDYSNDPVVRQMDSLQMGFGRLSHKIRGVQLTDQQYDDYARIAGRAAKLQLNYIVALPGFDMIPAEHRLDWINKVVRGSREMARNKVMMESRRTDNDIVAKATAAKAAALPPQHEAVP